MVTYLKESTKHASEGILWTQLYATSWLRGQGLPVGVQEPKMAVE